MNYEYHEGYNQGYEEGLRDGLLSQVKTLNPQSSDTIVIEFNHNMTFKDCNNAYKIISNCFPVHKILGICGTIRTESKGEDNG